MAQSLSADDCIHFIGRPVRDFIGGVMPLAVDDFVAPMPSASVGDSSRRRACLADDLHVSEPQSQVDQLISDLMDIIAGGADGASPAVTSESPEAVEKDAALSMMQALLQNQVCSSN